MTTQAAQQGTGPGNNPKWGLGFAAGVAGMLIGLLIAFPVFFAVGPATVFNEELQSPKLTAVWEEIEPLPIMIRAPGLFGIVTLLFGGIHGLIFVEIRKGLTGSTIRQGIVFGLILWAVGSLLFEFNGPYGLLGEPLPLVGVELAIALIAALIEGLVIASLYRRFEGRAA